MFYPFSDGDTFATFRNVIEQVKNEIQSLSNEYVLKASLTELEDYFSEKVNIDPLILHTEDYYIESQEPTQVDVSNDSRRFILPGRQAYVSGTRLVLAIPYEGDSALWKIRPSRYRLSGYPQINLKNNEVILSMSFPDDSINSSELKTRINREVESLSEAVQSLRSDVVQHNRGAADTIKNILQRKRQQAQAAVGAISALGIPIKRKDKPSTFTVPTQRRKSPKTRPTVSTEVYAPEPTLAEDEYEHILEVLRSMSLVIERSPGSFSTLDEEAIRTHFLLQLNGHYEGNASGETFNASGKTDILIRVKDRNIFIAECKFWRGPKGFNEAVDQLLGYLSWRDTKCALLIFNKTKDSNAVREKMHINMENRDEHKKTIFYKPNDDARYIFVKESDPGREVVITTQIYDIPV